MMPLSQKNMENSEYWGELKKKKTRYAVFKLFTFIFLLKSIKQLSAVL